MITRLLSLKDMAHINNNNNNLIHLSNNKHNLSILAHLHKITTIKPISSNSRNNNNNNNNNQPHTHKVILWLKLLQICNISNNIHQFLNKDHNNRNSHSKEHHLPLAILKLLLIKYNHNNLNHLLWIILLSSNNSHMLLSNLQVLLPHIHPNQLILLLTHPNNSSNHNNTLTKHKTIPMEWQPQ
ncbi:hypothetical protein BDA99DRAFT_268048 [Phascolomyces articulosus]|uniref:Uncharacterized protein n=1 Tax=Phascolomyces articulosus TaxID=60185 RepID=A0AAD5JY97_9FUNG|nr:hypothetical protein BDA99DRAFT_268048 [Phascolomyces articulosus]